MPFYGNSVIPAFFLVVPTWGSGVLFTPKYKINTLGRICLEENTLRRFLHLEVQKKHPWAFLAIFVFKTDHITTTAHHHHGTTEGSFTKNSLWASHWLVALRTFYIGKFCICFIILFLLKLPPPARNNIYTRPLPDVLFKSYLSNKTFFQRLNV